MIALHLEVLPLVADFVNLLGICEYPVRFVAPDGIGFPAPFPKLVDHLHELLGHFVALIMRQLRGMSEGPCRAV